jgi:hypothetical protein
VSRWKQARILQKLRQRQRDKQVQHDAQRANRSGLVYLREVLVESIRGGPADGGPSFAQSAVWPPQFHVPGWAFVPLAEIPEIGGLTDA